MFDGIIEREFVNKITEIDRIIKVTRRPSLSISLCFYECELMSVWVCIFCVCMCMCIVWGVVLMSSVLERVWRKRRARRAVTWTAILSCWDCTQTLRDIRWESFLHLFPSFCLALSFLYLSGCFSGWIFSFFSLTLHCIAFIVYACFVSVFPLQHNTSEMHKYIVFKGRIDWKSDLVICR